MKTDVVLGLPMGDEGKGKIVDVLADEYPVVARFQGGSAMQDIRFISKAQLRPQVSAVGNLQGRRHKHSRERSGS